jgi:hypothetical protein
VFTEIYFLTLKVDILVLVLVGFKISFGDLIEIQ